MKIEQQEREEVQSELGKQVKYSAKETRKKFFREYYSNKKVKEARRKLEKIETLVRSDFNTINSRV